MTLSELIQSQIKSPAGLNFAEFMHLALYAPQGGYYTSNLVNFGQDFTTAPELTPMFAASLGIQCKEILSVLSHPLIFEFGAGSGRLCCDLLKHLEHLDCLPEAYVILEVSGALQTQQRETIARELPHFVSKVQWITKWPKDPFEGIILANEVLDAMPVHRFLQTQDDIFEVFVDMNAEGGLEDKYQICQNDRLRQHIANIIPKDFYPYQSEVNLYLDSWMAHLAGMLRRGVALIIDYGFPRKEYYHPDRYQGTLMCHHQHRAHTNPYLYVGEQDLTAHVDFTHVAEAAVAVDLQVSGFTSLASFLLANGLLSLRSEMSVNENQALKCLLQPNEMGELFKVMALTKTFELPLSGFKMQDRRASL